MKSNRNNQRVSNGGKWSFFVTMPVFLLLFSYLTTGDHYFQDPSVFLGATGFNLICLCLTFFTQNRVNDGITRNFPTYRQSSRRIVLSLLANATMSGIFLIVIAFFYIHFRVFRSELTVKTVLIIYAVNLIVMGLTVLIKETFHSIERWKRHEMNKQKLIRQNLHSQLEGLKSQINPHFLFNSLNSLSALISEEPAKAQKFVDQMAKVYRYLLQNDHGDSVPGVAGQLTTLRKELLFIDSYNHLLKTRYDDALQLSVQVSESYMDTRIPPLTLQLLVENAVKHNVIRKNSPLFVAITINQEGSLSVANNFQPKAASSRREFESTRMGLANISSRYQLLTQTWPELHAPVINGDGEKFEILLPLIRVSNN